MNEPATNTNALINESSPYLLQHAHNPVNWLPWGTDAFQKAKEENKLVLISIGYASCHWCHVMEEQSFIDENVAEIMNRHFICIKVDREERPDVDKVYMDAVQLINGNGGWPLNCFSLPDGRAVFGGTYYPKDTWVELLEHLANLFKDEPQKFFDQAKSIEQGIMENDAHFIQPTQNKEAVDHEKIVGELQGYFDPNYGGFNDAPKFPMPVLWEYLLLYSERYQSNDVKNQVLHTLEKIASGGIYDHVGGGFCRYSVDEKWHVPHFEKMLYDNGQLLSLYSKALQISDNPFYKTIIEETVAFLKREMQNTDGAYFSAIDADSEGVEGKFYVWDYESFMKTINDDAITLAEYYKITSKGNWESGNNILHHTQLPIKFAANKNIDPNDFESSLKNAKNKLLQTRNKRIRPITDTKILLSWNALLVKGFIDAYKATGNFEHLLSAQQTANYIIDTLVEENGATYRTIKKGIPSIKGFLDDYAFTIEMLLELYQVDFNEKWLGKAHKISQYAIAHFYNDQTGLFFYNEADTNNTIPRKYEVADNVIPSSNAIMASNLSCLYKIYGEEQYYNIYNKMMEIQSGNLKFVRSFSKWATLSLNPIESSMEIVVTGPDYIELIHTFQNHFLPGITYAGANSESELPILKNRFQQSQNLIYICKNNQCYQPVKTMEEAYAFLNIIEK